MSRNGNKDTDRVGIIVGVIVVVMTVALVLSIPFMDSESKQSKKFDFVPFKVDTIETTVLP